MINIFIIRTTRLEMTDMTLNLIPATILTSHSARGASCCRAALGLDVGHPGVNNAFMINSRLELDAWIHFREVEFMGMFER
jgi:hypothetical protein